MDEGGSNDIAVLSYQLHFGLTAIIHDERGVVVLIVVTAASLEVELQHKKRKQHNVPK
jgi:hypothetical protein